MIPPVARIEVVQETYFGTTIDDPYRWMEDWQSDEARTWMSEQAAYARATLEGLPHRAALLSRIAELSGSMPTLHTFRIASGRSFSLRRDPGASVPVLAMRTAPAAPERVLLDPTPLPGEAQTSIDWYVPSPDGRLVAYGVSQGGSEESTLRVLDVESGAILEETISRVHFPFVSWLEDNRSFVYHRYPELPAGTSPEARRYESRSHLHQLGTDPEQDLLVLARGLNPRVEMTQVDRPFLVIPPQSAWMIAIISHSALGGATTTEQLSDCTFYVAPRAGLAHPATCPWVKVAEVEDGVTGFAVSGETLYLLTYRNAPRSRVLAVPFSNPALAQARVMLPESQAVIEAIAVSGDYLLARELDGGVGRLRRVPLEGGEPEDVPLPVQGSILEWTSEPGRTTTLLQFTSWAVSPRIYRYDACSGALEDTGWVPPSPVDVSAVEVHEVLAPARDGTLIPLSIIHQKGLARDGNSPTLLTGYGSYGYPFPAMFQPEMLAWYERGGIWAIAHLRGGGEYGREWHEAGRKLNKERTITDLIDCADYLIAQGYTRPARLAGEGSSAGGIPSGGALVRRPDLWAAMVLHVPVVNALRAEFSENGPINVPELGSVSTPEGFQSLLIADAYHRVQRGVPYPAVLLTTGLNDPRVAVWQPMKMTARLQAATTSGRPVVLRVEEQAGHGIGSTKAQQDALLADELAFLLHVFERE